MHKFRQLATAVVLAASVSALPALACPGHGHTQTSGYSISLESCVKVYRGKSASLNYNAIYKMEQIRLGEEKLNAERAHMHRMEAETARQTALIGALASRTRPVYSGGSQRRYYARGGYYGRPNYRPHHRPHNRPDNRSGHSNASAGGGNHNAAKAPVLAGGHSGKGGGKKSHH